jgi:hypothetical protein
VGLNTTETLAMTDLPQIAEAFLEFAKKEKFSFVGK